MYKSQPHPMSAGDLRASQGFVESEESDFTGDESIEHYPSAAESESAVESESAIEITGISQGDESNVPRTTPSQNTKSDGWNGENGVPIYEQAQTHGFPPRSKTYKKTAHSSGTYNELRQKLNWISRIMKWTAYGILGFLSLTLAIGFMSSTLELVGDDIRRVVCTETLAPYLSICNPPARPLSKIQENTRAQTALIDVQSVFKPNAELPGILTSAQFAAESITGAVRNNLHPSKERAQISKALFETIELIKPMRLKSRNFNTEVVTLVSYALNANKHMRDKLQNFVRPNDTHEVKILEKVEALLQRKPIPQGMPHDIYESYTKGLGRTLGKLVENGGELLQDFIDLEKRVGEVQFLLGSWGKSHRKRMHSWPTIFSQLNDELRIALHAIQPRENLTGCFEGTKQRLYKGILKVRCIKEQVDNLAIALATQEIGFEDEVDLEVWRKEMEGVIKMLEPADKLELKTRMRVEEVRGMDGRNERD